LKTLILTILKTISFILLPVALLGSVQAKTKRPQDLKSDKNNGPGGYYVQFSRVTEYCTNSDLKILSHESKDDYAFLKSWKDWKNKWGYAPGWGHGKSSKSRGIQYRCAENDLIDTGWETVSAADMKFKNKNGTIKLRANYIKVKRSAKAEKRYYTPDARKIGVKQYKYDFEMRGYLECKTGSNKTVFDTVCPRGYGCDRNRALAAGSSYNVCTHATKSGIFDAPKGYKRYDYHYVKGYNLGEKKGINVYECGKTCSLTQGCGGFDYDLQKGLCVLQSTAYKTKQSKTLRNSTSYKYHHYQKRCSLQLHFCDFRTEYTWERPLPPGMKGE